MLWCRLWDVCFFLVTFHIWHSVLYEAVLFVCLCILCLHLIGEIPCILSKSLLVSLSVEQRNIELILLKFNA